MGPSIEKIESMGLGSGKIWTLNLPILYMMNKTTGLRFFLIWKITMYKKFGDGWNSNPWGLSWEILQDRRPSTKQNKYHVDKFII